MNPIADKLDPKPFICCGQTFTVTNLDSKGEIPANTFTIHSCDKITVAQDHRGIKRYFKRK